MNEVSVQVYIRFTSEKKHKLEPHNGSSGVARHNIFNILSIDLYDADFTIEAR